MGVSGSGKSTIGKLLSGKTGIPFFDGDDYHPSENIKKMSSGLPLNDFDREEWLKSLNTLSKEKLNTKGAIIACSALKEKYRNTLSNDIKKNIDWVVLFGDKQLILKRMMDRNHFMPVKLLDSQFETFEKPDYGLHISIEKTPQMISNTIKTHFNL